jgi:outer membrane lipoprotein-sorting protein
MGRKLRIVVCLAVLALIPCSPAAAQDALQLLHKMQQALGGADKIAGIQDFEQSVRAETWDNDGHLHGTVRKRTRWVRPNILRLDQVGPDDTYVLYFDGKTGWEILPDQSVANLEGGELKFAEKYLRDFNLHLWLADRDPRYAIASPALNVIAISVQGDSTSKLEITLDPGTFLPVKQTAVSLSDPGNPVASETRFDHWAAYGEVMFAERITIFQEGKKAADITVEQTKVNTGIKADDLAIKPSDRKPVMAR